MTIRAKLYTRQQIIDIWSEQKEEHKNTFCCPNCRDLVYDHPDSITPTEIFEWGFYYCQNDLCNNYNKPIEHTPEVLTVGEVMAGA